MNADGEFEYASYKKVEQPQYDDPTHKYFEHKMTSYVNFDMKSLYPNAPEEKLCVLQEIYDSEKSYVTFLTVVSEVFVPLLTSRGCVSKKRSRALFGEISAICQTNQILLESLRTKTIAEAFLKLLPYLKLYASYASKYPNSLKTYAELMLREPFLTTLNKIEADTRCQNYSLNALLIMPVQRIPRYILLIEKLMLFTTEPQDMHNLCKVVAEMRELSNHMQMCVATFENGERLLEIQKSFGLSKHVFEPGRRFIKEGIMYKKEMSGKSLFSERIVYLFNDVLLYGKKRIGIGSKYEPSAMIALRHTKVEHISTDGTLRLECGDISLIFTNDTFDGVEEWYDAIATAIERSQLLRKTLRKESFSKKVIVFDKGFLKRKCDAIRTIVTNNGGVSGAVERVLSRRRPLTRMNDSEFLNGNWTNRKRKNSKTGSPEAVKSKRNDDRPLCRNCELEIDNVDDTVFETPILEPTTDEGVDEEDRRPREFGAERERLAMNQIRTLSYQKYDWDEPVEEEVKTVGSRTKSPWWVNESAPPAIKNQRPKILDSIRNGCSIM